MAGEILEVFVLRCFWGEYPLEPAVIKIKNALDTWGVLKVILDIFEQFLE